MDNISLGLLWFFIFLRAVIFAGLVYFAITEYRKYRRRQTKNEGRDKKGSED